MVIKYYRVLFVILLAVILLYVESRVTEMDVRLFQSSSQGIQGLAYYLTGNYGNAAAAYRAHLQNNGWRNWAKGRVGYAALLRGDLPAATREADFRLGEHPDDIEALLTRGEVALEEGDFRRAASIFDSVLEQDKNHFDAFLFAAVAHTHAGRPGPAIDRLGHALRIDSRGSRVTALVPSGT
jgi:tetratricopeptide (TPR) repeat protein